MKTFIQEKSGYAYHIDYSDSFIDFTVVDDFKRRIIENDFIDNLMMFLHNEMNISNNRSYVIAKTLLSAMTNPDMHYHSPTHILAIFSFVAKNNIELKDWERLAIWFHDAVVIPNSKNGDDEHQSVAFMRSLIPGGNRMTDNSVVNNAERAILATSDHIEADVNQLYCKLLDLDLFHFSTTWDYVQDTLIALRKEFGSIGSDRQWQTGTRRIIDCFLQRDKFYRTSWMRERYETKAQNNIKKVYRHVSPYS